MNPRGLRRYVDDLLRGRRPRSFRPDDFEAAQIRTAIELRASRPGDDTPSQEFLSELRGRLTEQMRDMPVSSAQKRWQAPRRTVLVGTSTAAAAAAVAVTADHLLTPAPQTDAHQAPGEILPNTGSWQRVAVSNAVPDGGVHPFDLGFVNGFVRRVGGRVEAVSGVCTHQGCKLWFDGANDRLQCPCHTTSFTTDGRVITHQLPIAPKPLPTLQVREAEGHIEVFAPDRPV
ncbi:rieske [2Fe-2S] domain-containing protein [Mycobacteroides abscessus]|uniref:(2Fe-2S)-binding protein n=2 Tax=Mycobacteroides abscessus TaxID=36809 RepID=A0A829HN86_9MYCO|nr:Rieske (2Fe-2S) protein [Mycobacteroides abscessus]ESV57509.1 rieske domain protein [Mycobacteroides abscessus MAB_082312_2258]AIC71087.1 (2Fe-2S)-binding protein [Mycobacteroides abscessus subsp. massiliense str. GO 06]AMU28320.1 (2Fe-2S)-binding protein [Mycobacteroides abscessus]AMU37949.1 (2Fe-2S)-binding protein [Mycobacteroides abscessus]AMU42992.1 (2Fe-2S)-binding protein [Mycobacteroides abscessus]